MKLVKQVQKVIKKEGLRRLVIGLIMLFVSALLLITCIPFFKEGIHIILIIMCGSGIVLFVGGGIYLFEAFKLLCSDVQTVIKNQLREVGSPEHLMSVLEDMPSFDVYNKEKNIIKINEDIAFFAVREVVRAVKKRSILSTSIVREDEQRIFGGRHSKKIMYKIVFEIKGGKPFSIKLAKLSDCTNLVAHIDMYRRAA